LEGRGGDARNVSRLIHNLPKALGERTVSLLNVRELREWRNGLVKGGLAPASADRTARILKASLNLCAKEDLRVTNSMAWRAGLSRLPDSERPRNTILTDDQVRRVIAAAYVIDPAYGIWIETHATTGARSSQIEGLRVCDLQDGASPRLMMPSSRKGRRRRIERRPVPIPISLAKSLRLATADRDPHDALLQPPVCRRQLFEWFKRAVASAGLDPEVVSIYALRHSAIVRMLLAGIPIRAAASVVDTSSTMIERNYSAFIGDHSDALIRRALLDVGTPAGANVISMSGAQA
jgi:integrase